MDKHIAEGIEEGAQDFGKEVEVREDYSGRGMYGDTTTALIASDISDVIVGMIQFAVNMKEAEDDETIDLICKTAEHLRTDQMGLGIVVY